MPWVRFIRPFDWKPTPPVTIAYKEGATVLVTRACAVKAVARGLAVRADKPKGA